jgi:hypothetical protein
VGQASRHMSRFNPFPCPFPFPCPRLRPHRAREGAGEGEMRDARGGAENAERVGTPASSGSEAAGYGRERDRVGAHSPDLLSSRGRRAGPGLAVMVGRQTPSHRSPAAADHPCPSIAHPASAGRSLRSLRALRFKSRSVPRAGPLRGLCVLCGSKAVLHPWHLFALFADFAVKKLFCLPPTPSSPAPLCALRGLRGSRNRRSCAPRPVLQVFSLP